MNDEATSKRKAEGHRQLMDRFDMSDGLGSLELIKADMKNISIRPDANQDPEQLDVKAIRQDPSVNMTQRQFAAKFEISLGSIRSWEQGIDKPSSGSRMLLKLVEAYPKQILDLVNSLEGSSKKL